MSIRNPPLTYFPSLVQGVPTELKRNKQKKEAVKKQREAVREQPHQEKNIDTNPKVILFNFHK